MAEVRLENVTKYYHNDDQRGGKMGKRRGRNQENPRLNYAVREINLTIEQGEFVFLIGSSGAGKSTLLRLMSGELKPDEGMVFLNGANMARMMGPWKAKATRTFGVVSQQGLLIRKRTVWDNLLMAANAAGLRRKGEDAARKALSIVGLPNVGNCYPAELSIGESRRVELARAVLNSPSILLLDELTANLDDDLIWDLLHLLTELNSRGTTVVMATHASQYVNIMRKRVITLVDGKVAGDVRNGKYGDIV